MIFRFRQFFCAMFGRAILGGTGEEIGIIGLEGRSHREEGRVTFTASRHSCSRVSGAVRCVVCDVPRKILSHRNWLWDQRSLLRWWIATRANTSQTVQYMCRTRVIALGSGN